MADLTPYLDKESAILWLSEHLANDEIDVKTMYHLNIINNLIKDGKNLFHRLPEEVSRGTQEGGRRNVAASVVARAISCTDREESQSIRASGYTRTQELIGRWAEKDGCWHDYADSYLTERGMRFATSGSEAHVYSSSSYVYKINDYNHYGTVERLLDRISIHNTFFPETRLEVIGFGMKDDSEDNRGFSLILKQPLIQGEAVTDPEKVFESLTKLGLAPLNSSSWCFTNSSKDILLSDIHDQNIVQTKTGEVFLFDCEAELNTNPKTMGHYVIPQVQGSQESVRAIDNLLEEMCPKEISIDEIARYNINAASALLSGKNYEGTVCMLKEGKKTEFCVQRTADGKYLAVEPSTIDLMLHSSNLSAIQKNLLRNGKRFSSNGRSYFFDIEKGRLNSVPERKLKLSHSLSR